MNFCVVKIPLSATAKKYYEYRYHSRMDESGYIRLDKNHRFGRLLICFMDPWEGKWEIPVITGSFIKVKIPSLYMKFGLPPHRVKELSKILEAEAMEFLVNEIANTASNPSISVTEAIITVMAQYDISDEDYRTDSMRRHFDRYCREVKGVPFKEFSRKLNTAWKVLFERIIQKQKNSII